ncbi:MAG TPA: DUF89 family protein [Campylobacterales bacterium]|nr:DUF89 family protein [Campylobacterales bacterium]
MNVQSDCLACLLNQSLRVAKNLKLTEEASQELVRVASAAIANYREVSPPVAAADLYPKLGNCIGIDDVYAELKAYSTAEAKKLLPSVEASIAQAPDRLKAAIKAAVAGNVIDFATPNHFDLTEEFRQVFQTPFALDDEEAFFEQLREASSLMIIGDNVGEHLFDKLLLRELGRAYPELCLYYAVRGCPIINDVTMKEATQIGMDEVAALVDSGVDTPGLDYAHASEAFMELYGRMDIIIAKGMGNYECLNEVKDARIYHLFKVKCDVVSQSVGAQLGSLVFRCNKHLAKLN